jgi:hypothetical protein
MSKKRRHIDDPGDPRVSAAYRETARERTPGHLDHTILNAARAAAKPRWRTAVTWLRPAAWVATIGVCLAIVVEISLLPDPAQTEFDSLPQEAVPAAPAAPAARMKRPEKPRPQAAAPQKVQGVQALKATTSSDLAVRSDDADAGAAADKRESGLEEAESRTRQLPASGDQAPGMFLRSAPTPDLAEEIAAERYCDESQTANPNTWLECILDLERQGLHDAARLERERLAEAFPPPNVIP